MKKIFTICLVFIALSVNAQIPEQISYQAIVRNSNNQLLVSTTIGMKISILHNSATGTAVYEETQTPATNINGLVSIKIGNGTVVSGSISSIDWSDGTYFIKTQIDIAGGTNYTITGTTQILSVPYALYAKKAEIASSASYNNITDKPDLSNYATKNMNNENITHLANPQNANDAATKEYIDKLLNDLGFIPNNYSGVVKDTIGNIYKTIKIGTQTWMAENLKTTKYKDGSSISLVTDQTSWAALTTPAYCYYENSYNDNGSVYGALYNWFTVNTGNLCPTGWHIPSNGEWSDLRIFINSNGGMLKSRFYWASPNTSATNETGFTALPGGERYLDGNFYFITSYGYWWASYNFSTDKASIFNLSYNFESFDSGEADKNNGFSVRCIKD